ncbi:MAG: hypothetical protein J6386_10630 [Candidatus Synoicihabitans palmerolidicus]|nr:hypothetical protein [Candidatus Synoicihabitans palmerolidicus]
MSEALVGMAAASEWRVELTAVIAEAYRQVGEEEVATRIEADLRRLFPNSRWLPPAART